MRWGLLFSLVFIIFVIILLDFYWFFPANNIEFAPKNNANSNFTINGNNTMQFYPNMRFPSNEISYKIYDCPLQKKNDMEQAFDFISNKTVLRFYSVLDNEEISVTCDSKDKTEGRLFIAGEGGPVNITQTNLFNVILTGKILLIKQSTCQNSNIAIHELLHVLGFMHSTNENNIMYPISNCNQIIGEDMVNLINQLYSVKSLPDLTFENVSADIKGGYLNTEIIVINQGLMDSESAKIFIYADQSLIKEINLEPLKIGEGLKITLKDILIIKLNTKELDFFINSSQNELDKDNNKIILKED